MVLRYSSKHHPKKFFLFFSNIDIIFSLYIIESTATSIIVSRRKFIWKDDTQ